MHGSSWLCPHLRPQSVSRPAKVLLCRRSWLEVQSVSVSEVLTRRPASGGDKLVKMPSEEAIAELIEDKFVTVKEELEEIIDEVKNDVDEKSVEISNNKRSQEQSFAQIQNAMEKLRKDLKQLGKFSLRTFSNCQMHIRPLTKTNGFDGIKWFSMGNKQIFLQKMKNACLDFVLFNNHCCNISYFLLYILINSKKKLGELTY